jgi:hypothetical protein
MVIVPPTGDPVHPLVGGGREERLLEEQLEAIGEGLKPAERACSVRPPASPEPGDCLALVHDHEQHREHQERKHRDELDQEDYPDDEVESLGEERVSRVGQQSAHSPSA